MVKLMGVNPKNVSKNVGNNVNDGEVFLSNGGGRSGSAKCRDGYKWSSKLRRLYLPTELAKKLLNENPGSNKIRLSIKNGKMNPVADPDGNLSLHCKQFFVTIGRDNVDLIESVIGG